MEEQEVEYGGIMDEIRALSSKSLSQHMDETKFSLKFPVKTKSGALVTKTMRLEYETDTFGTGGGVNYRWGYGPVRTAQMKVAYCWSTRRNKAGYFIGWREVERHARKGYIVRDQLIARKSKKRLKDRQMRMRAALVEKTA